MFEDVVLKRTILGTQLFAACFVAYLVRACFTIQIVAMVEERAGVNTMFDFGPRYDWSEKQQGYLLGGYYMGYVMGSFIAGWFAENYNTVRVLAFVSAFQGFLCALMPFLCGVHWTWVLVNRITCGVLGSFILPGCHTLISRWAPKNERSLTLSALLGGSTGTLVLWTILGHIIPEYGWESSWYFLGAIVATWSLVFLNLCSPSPDSHSTITSSEKSEIQQSLVGLKPKSDRKVTPPIESIFISPAFLSWTILHFGSDWGLFFLLNMAPKYLVEFVEFDIQYSGALAGIPNVCRCGFGIVFGLIGDQLHENWSPTRIRKTFVLFSHVIPGICMMLLTYCDSEIPCLALTLLMLAVGFNGASVLTNNQNHHDLAPNYAGSIFGYANGLSATLAAIASYVTRVYLSGIGNEADSWRLVFLVGACGFWFTALQFVVCGSATIQKFNEYTHGEKPSKSDANKPQKTKEKPKEQSKPEEKPITDGGDKPEETPKPGDKPTPEDKPKPENKPQTEEKLKPDENPKPADPNKPAVSPTPASAPPK